MSTNFTIHIGFWTNLSKGDLYGSTLTLTNRNGAVLIAALAIFIQLAGSRSWTIISFIAHQIRTTLKARNGLHHQQQAILRNNNSDISAIWQFTKTGWAWRHASINSFRKSTLLILTGVVHFLVFIALSILSSHVATVGNLVLLAPSPYCGPWGATSGAPIHNSSLAGSIGYQSWGVASLEASRQFVQDCLTQSQNLPECRIYQKPQLNWTLSFVPCPFDGLCLGAGNSSISMDTGMIDSRDDLGINSVSEDRVQWRRNATCVPIITERYTRSGNSSYNKTRQRSVESGDPFPEHTLIPFNYTAAFYGPNNVNISFTGLTDPALQNSTYIYTNFRDIVAPYYTRMASSYDIDVEVGDLGKGFTPISALSHLNATISLIFASFPGSFESPSDDLWLSAHRKIKVAVQSNGTFSTGIQYGIDKPVSVLACAEHIQFCNPALGPPNSTSCSPPLSISRMKKLSLEGLFTNKHQIATATAILHSSSWSNFYDTVASLEPKLLAESLVATTLSLALAPDQWVQEVTNWFSVGLANMQRLILDYNTGPPSQFLQFVQKGQADNGSPGLKWLCSNQIIQRNDFTNFSTLGIAVLFTVGVVIIGASLCLETVVGRVRSSRKRAEWKQEAWWSEETLNLQRSAVEGMSAMRWERGAFAVPVTTPGKEWSSILDSSATVLSSTQGQEGDGVGRDKRDFEDRANVPRIEITSVSSHSTVGFHSAKRVRSMSV